MFWNFSPHALTHTTPQFLLGANDWGISNIYAFTKLACWIGLILGGLANTLCTLPASTTAASTLKWRLNLNRWHFFAVVMLFLSATLPEFERSVFARDMGLLLIFFFVGALVTLLVLFHAQRNSWSQLATIGTILLVTIPWGLVPVSLGRP